MAPLLPWPCVVLTFVVMNETDLAALDRDALIGLVRKLVAEVESLRAEVETRKRSGKRQAAPFSKGTRAKAPKAGLLRCGEAYG